MPHLFDELRIRETTFRNRLWLSPMCQYSCEERDGRATDWHLVHLGAFASGGAGLVMTEAAAVDPVGRISPWDLGVWDDGQADALARVVRVVHDRGARAGIQLAHAGRKGSVHRAWSGSGAVPAAEGGWRTVAPTADAYPGLPAPEALDAEGVGGVVDAFAAAAVRAVRAGFDAVELHAAHGYLLHQFLSPLSNTRDDRYGGDLAGRARLLLDTVRAVRAAVGDGVPVLVRVSATDGVPGGLETDDVARVAAWCVEAGADHLDVSTGGLDPRQTIRTGPRYQVPHAVRVAEAVHPLGATVNAVGLIESADDADDLVATGGVDAVMVGRRFLRDPHFGLLAAAELGAGEELWPVQYRRAIPR